MGRTLIGVLIAYDTMYLSVSVKGPIPLNRQEYYYMGYILDFIWSSVALLAIL